MNAARNYSQVTYYGGQALALTDNRQRACDDCGVEWHGDGLSRCWVCDALGHDGFCKARRNKPPFEPAYRGRYHRPGRIWVEGIPR